MVLVGWFELEQHNDGTRWVAVCCLIDHTRHSQFETSICMPRLLELCLHSQHMVESLHIFLADGVSTIEDGGNIAMLLNNVNRKFHVYFMKAESLPEYTLCSN